MKGDPGKDGKDAIPLYCQIERAASSATMAISPKLSPGTIWVSPVISPEISSVTLQVIYESSAPRKFAGEGVEAEYNFGNVSLLIGESQQLPFVNLSRSEAVIDIPYIVGTPIRVRYSARTFASIALIDSGLRRRFYRVSNADQLPTIDLI